MKHFRVCVASGYGYLLQKKVAMSPVVTAILTLFGAGGIWSLFRLRVDRNQIVVQTAQGAVIVQSSVIDNLQEEIGRLETMVAELRDENKVLRRRVASLERGQASARSDIDDIQDSMS